MPTIKNKIVDVLIVGDGIAGCIAALAARKRGAGVMIIEKSQPNVPHGNTAFCGGSQASFQGISRNEIFHRHHEGVARTGRRGAHKNYDS